MNEEEANTLVHTDPNFVNAKRFEYSLARVEEKYPEVCPDHVIADLLMINEEQLTEAWEEVIEVLAVEMGVPL